MDKDIKDLLNSLDLHDFKKAPNHFLTTWEHDDNIINGVLKLTALLKALYFNNISPKIYDSGLAVSIFRDNSTRTRYSWASGSNLLGLTVADLDETKSQIAHGETIMESANMVSFLTRAIGIRDDIYLGLGHKYMEEVARSVDLGYKEGVLAQRPTVINLQSDEDHTTQALSDTSHLISYFGGVENLKGKNVVMSWAYSPSYGKPLSVAQGYIAMLSRYGANITLAYPKGYNLIPKIEDYSKKQAKQSGGSFRITNDMADAFKNADAVHPKSWAPFWVMEERTKLLKKGDKPGLEELQKTALAENAKHKDWSCTEKMMKLTRKGKGLYMHCLPADITGVSTKEGEVDKSVFNRYRKQTYLQAEYKPFVVASLIMLGQIKGRTQDLLKKMIYSPNKISI